MGNVVKLHPEIDVAACLRNIADSYEKGEYGDEECTVVIGRNVFHSGCADDARAAANAVFDCQVGIAILMGAVVGV